MKTGISKTTPKARRNLSIRDIYSLKEIMGLRISEENVMKNAKAGGNTRKYPKRMPPTNSNVEVTTKGAYVTLLTREKTRRYELPYLIERIGRCEEERGEEGDLHVDEEGLG